MMNTNAPKARTVALYARDGHLTGVVGFSAAAAVMRLRADIAATHRTAPAQTTAAYTAYHKL